MLKFLRNKNFNIEPAVKTEGQGLYIKKDLKPESGKIEIAILPNFYIAFPDLMTYSYIKKIEPLNKFGTKRRPQNKFGTKRRPQNKLGTIMICTSFNRETL